MALDEVSENARNVADEIVTAGGTAIAVVGSAAANADMIVQEALDHFGRLDVVGEQCGSDQWRAVPSHLPRSLESRVRFPLCTHACLGPLGLAASVGLGQRAANQNIFLLHLQCGLHQHVHRRKRRDICGQQGICDGRQDAERPRQCHHANRHQPDNGADFPIPRSSRCCATSSSPDGSQIWSCGLPIGPTR